MFRLGRIVGLLSLTGVPIFVCCGGSSDSDGSDADSNSTDSGWNGSSSTGATIVDEVPQGGTPAGGVDPNAPPPIIGGGTNSAPLGEGCGPETAAQCHPVGGDCNPGSLPPDHQVIDTDTTCFYEPEAEEPSAVAEYVTEVQNGEEYVHLRITFHPSFVDNVYGECAAQTGWGGDETEAEPEPDPMDPKPMDGKPMKPPKGKGGHTFDDLVGSDHVELMLSDCDGSLAMHVKLDYISEASSSGCGYASGGVTVGEGKVIVGSAEHVLASSSSLDRNMNGCGYCELENSPCPGENYGVNPDAPQWDYRVVYEMWIDTAAFGDAGFCDVDIDAVHASPSKKEENTVLVEPGDCPPPPCPPDYELYLTSEGESVCVPSGDCPDGYVIDLTSEGESCVQVK